MEQGANDLTSEDESERSRSLSLSPLAGKGSKWRSPAKQEIIREEREFIPDPPMLPSDTEDAELTESEPDSDDGTVESDAETGSVGASATTESEYESDEDYAEEEDELALSSAKTPRAKPAPKRVASPTPAPRMQVPTPRVSKLEREMNDLTLGEMSPDSPVIVQKKKKR
jgi:kinesin family protein 20